jgi:hypothetical protein
MDEVLGPEQGMTQVEATCKMTENGEFVLSAEVLAEFCMKLQTDLLPYQGYMLTQSYADFRHQIWSVVIELLPITYLSGLKRSRRRPTSF